MQIFMYELYHIIEHVMFVLNKIKNISSFFLDVVAFKVVEQWWNNFMGSADMIQRSYRRLAWNG